MASLLPPDALNSRECGSLGLRGHGLRNLRFGASGAFITAKGAVSGMTAAILRVDVFVAALLRGAVASLVSSSMASTQQSTFPETQ